MNNIRNLSSAFDQGSFQDQKSHFDFTHYSVNNK